MSATPSEEGHTPHPQAQGQAPEREQQTTLFSHEEMSEQSEIPIAVWRTYVNLADWDKDVNINDAPTAIELTTYFVRTLMEAIWLKQTGKEVRSSFREDLAGWSIYQFDQINRTIKKRMLQLLEQDQVTIPGATMSARLARVLDSNAPPRITQQTTTFAGREEQNLHEIPLRPRLPQPIPSIEVSPQPYGAEDAGRAEQIHTMSPGARTTQEVWSYPQPAYGNRTTTTPMPVDEYDLPPSKPVESKPLDPAKISAFQKGWRSARNYTGKPYDILYDKARIFISFCHRLQIDESQYHAAAWAKIYLQAHYSFPQNATNLILASYFGHKGVVRVLLDTGKVDVDAKDGDGLTPLSWAAAGGHSICAPSRLRRGNGRCKYSCWMRDVASKTRSWFHG